MGLLYDTVKTYKDKEVALEKDRLDNTRDLNRTFGS